VALIHIIDVRLMRLKGATPHPIRYTPERFTFFIMMMMMMMWMTMLIMIYNSISTVHSVTVLGHKSRKTYTVQNKQPTE